MSDINQIGGARGVDPAVILPSKEAVTLTLTSDQAAELSSVLDEVLGELSTEIADTDNARYRSVLQGRRDQIREIREALPAT
jgi:hypothetical protein